MTVSLQHTNCDSKIMRNEWQNNTRKSSEKARPQVLGWYHHKAAPVFFGQLFCCSYPRRHGLTEQGHQRNASLDYCSIDKYSTSCCASQRPTPKSGFPVTSKTTTSTELQRDAMSSLLDQGDYDMFEIDDEDTFREDREKSNKENWHPQVSSCSRSSTTRTTTTTLILPTRSILGRHKLEFEASSFCEKARRSSLPYLPNGGMLNKTSWSDTASSLWLSEDDLLDYAPNP